MAEKPPSQSYLAHVGRWGGGYQSFRQTIAVARAILGPEWLDEVHIDGEHMIHSSVTEELV